MKPRFVAEGVGLTVDDMDERMSDGLEIVERCWTMNKFRMNWERIAWKHIYEEIIVIVFCSWAIAVMKLLEQKI